MPLFQNSINFKIDGSIKGFTLFDTGLGPAGGGPDVPVEIIQAGNTWDIKIEWEIHNFGCTLLNSGHKWKLSVKLEGWGLDAETDVAPVFQSLVGPYPASPNNDFTETLHMPAQFAGVYKPVVLIQLFNGNNAVAVAGYEELPLIHFFE